MLEVDLSTPSMFQSLMPKGVEHSTITIALQAVDRMFQSLMPKGVEHSSWGALALILTDVSISDAERR